MNANVFLNTTGTRVARPGFADNDIQAFIEAYEGGLDTVLRSGDFASLRLSRTSLAILDIIKNKDAMQRIRVQNAYIADGFNGKGSNPRYFVNPNLKVFQNLHTGFARSFIPFSNAIYSSVQKWYNTLQNNDTDQTCVLVIDSFSDFESDNIFRELANTMIADALVNITGDDSSDEVVASKFSDANEDPDNVVVFKGCGPRARLIIHFFNPWRAASDISPSDPNLGIQEVYPVRGFDLFEAVVYGFNRINRNIYGVEVQEENGAKIFLDAAALRQRQLDAKPPKVGALGKTVSPTASTTSREAITVGDGDTLAWDIDEQLNDYYNARIQFESFSEAVLQDKDMKHLNSTVKSLYHINAVGLSSYLSHSITIGNVLPDPSQASAINGLVGEAILEFYKRNFDLMSLDNTLFKIILACGGTFTKHKGSGYNLKAGSFSTPGYSIAGESKKFLFAVRAKEASISGKDVLGRFLEKYGTPKGVPIKEGDLLNKDLLYARSSFGYANVCHKKTADEMRKVLSTHVFYNFDGSTGLYSCYPYQDATKTVRYVL